MPKIPHEDPPRKLTLSVPSSTLVQVQLRLVNPLTMQTRYGELSGLVTNLLRRWLSEQDVIDPGSTPPFTTTNLPESESKPQQENQINGK